MISIAMKSIVVALCLGCAYGDSFTCPRDGCAKDNVMLQALQRETAEVDLFGGKVLKPGMIVAIHNDKFNRLMRLKSDGGVDGGAGVATKIHPDWQWEKFTVVDAGSGQIALHSPAHNRFLRMRVNAKGGWLDTCCKRNEGDLIDEWKWERFEEVPLGGGHFALFSPVHRRFIRMEGAKINTAGRVEKPILPKDWEWERFTAQVLKGAPKFPRVARQLKPGRQVAIRSAAFNRFLRLTDKGKVDAGDEAEKINPAWQWERFTVVNAGDGLIALHSKAHNRFLRMNSKHEIDTAGQQAVNALPKWWQWEKFLEVPLGGGKIALYSTAFHRFVRMNHNRADASASVIGPILPKEWTWEQWTVQLLNKKPPQVKPAPKPKPARKPQRSDYINVKGQCKSGRIGPKECNRACAMDKMPICWWDASGCIWIGDTDADDYGELCRKKR